jgi:fucose permease
MPQPFHRDRSTWLAYLLLAFYGYFLNILGPITPFLKDELSLSYTVASLHYTAFALGILLVGLFGHLLIRRTGQRRALWIGAFGMSLSVLVLLFGRTPILTIGACFLMGLVGSLILVIVPSVLAELHGESRPVALSEANVVSSLFATLAPLMVGWAAPLPGGWRLALGIAALVPLIMRFAFGGQVLAGADAAQERSSGPRKPLPGRFWIFWAAIVLAVSVEFCMISWSADYLETGLGMPQVQAAQSVSLFLGAMIIGRLAASRLVQRFPVRGVVLASVLTAMAGFALYWSARNPIPGLIGLFITGLGVAGLYPLLLSVALGAAGGDTVQAGARATLASGTAILLLPLTLGRLADFAGIRPAYGVVAVLLAGVLGILLAVKRK